MLQKSDMVSVKDFILSDPFSTRACTHFVYLMTNTEGGPSCTLAYRAKALIKHRARFCGGRIGRE